MTVGSSQHHPRLEVVTPPSSAWRNAPLKFGGMQTPNGRYTDPRREILAPHSVTTSATVPQNITVNTAN